MALEQEIAYFEAHRQEFLSEHDGKFALIKGERSYGFFDTPETALDAGIRQFGRDGFLIKQVVKEERSEWIPALSCGLLHAAP